MSFDGLENDYENDLGERPPKKKKTDHEAQLPGTRRVAACQACRLRKVKCDKKRPCCALCQASGMTCEYLNESSEKITLETATQTILDRLDQLRAELDTVKRATVTTASFTHPAAAPSVSSFLDTPAQVLPQDNIPIDSALTAAAAAVSSTSYEPSRDFLRIPPHRASADTIIQWEVFEGKYPPNALIGVLFRPDQSEDGQTPPAMPSTTGQQSPSNGPDPSSTSSSSSSKGLTPPDDEQIPALVDRFLTNVYTKNPILDVERLVKHGRQCADRGVGWDGWSCLVLLACALGSVAKPFDRSLQLAKPVPEEGKEEGGAGMSSARVYKRELQQGESCFTLACRRLGSLKYSMLGAQCYFFAGVYLMYTLRPIQSWHYFYQASIFHQFNLRMTHGLSDSFAEVLGSPFQRHATTAARTSLDRKNRRLEQSLYWSCFKSECEFRVELPLPQSELCLGEYPNLFPSPPSPVSQSTTTTTTAAGAGAGAGSDSLTTVDGMLSPVQSLGQTPSSASENMAFGSIHGTNTGATSNTNVTGGTSSFTEAASMTAEELELRQHSTRLCREEESWYYYLTEIALRRISNRIINTFFPSTYPDPSRLWLSNIRPLLRMAQEFEAQVSSWSAHLPPAMQQYETSSIIRAPHLNYESESAGGNVSRELSWAIDNRLLEMQTWLYQPFLYYFIHSGRNGAAAAGAGNTSAGGAAAAAGISTRLDGRQANNINNLLNPWSPSAATTSTTHSIDFSSAGIPNPTPLTATVTDSSGSSNNAGGGDALDSEEVAVLNSLITSGIECCLKTIDVRARYHRHHGLWYDLRSIMSASLILLAVVKSGNAAWIPGGEVFLWGDAVRTPDGSVGTNTTTTRRPAAAAAAASTRTSGGGRSASSVNGMQRPIGGKIGKVLRQFDFWAEEAPDMMRQKQVLESLTRDIRGF